MPLFKITVKLSGVVNGVRIEKGMSVEVASQTDPVGLNGSVLIHEAFLRKYGIDSKRAGVLTAGRYTTEKL